MQPRPNDFTEGRNQR